MSAATEPLQALNLDISQQQSFIRFFNNLPSKPSSAIRFFNRGDYYSVHGDDANTAAGFTCTTIKYMGEHPKLCYLCLSKSQFELFLRELLLVRQYRVEVYIKSAQNKQNDWYVEYKGSPGNLTQFEDILFESTGITFTNTVLGVKIVKDKILAIGCVNATESKFQVCELNDNECFTELEALIAQLGPKECVIPVGETPELISIRKVLERNGVLVGKVKRSEFSATDIEQDLNRLLFFHEGHQRNVSTIPETNLKEAMGSLQAAIKYLNLMADERNFNQFKISTVDIHRYVRIDNAALYALNVLPKPGSSTLENSVLLQNSGKSHTLKGILDSCVTNQGKRLLDQWIKQPLKDFNLINERLDVVECLMKNAEVRSLLTKDCLTRLPDLVMLSKKLLSKKANLEDCYGVYQIVGSIPYLLSVLQSANNKCIRALMIDPISEIVADMERYQSMIEQILDLSLVDRGEYLVKSTFQEELHELYKKKNKIEEKMQKLLGRTADELNLEEGKVKLECNEQFGYFFRVTLKEEPVLRANKNYKILGVIKGGVRFTSNKLKELNEEYSGIKEAYEEQQKAVVSEVFEVAAGYADTLRSLNLLIATVDLLASFATAAVAARIPYVRPKLHQLGAGILKLKRVRHPCLEQQDDVAFIPNDVSFAQGEKTLHIITGPNMCGKSTYIRSVGVCALMAHIGSFVPCEEAEMSLVDGILARVGAEDCQLKGLSTFALEMIETASIIESATQNSLVIIDELGRGTSTYDGCGIAFAIAEHLASEIKCFSLFATHFHEITRLAEMFDSVGNLHVTAVTTNDTITPLYQVREGECDKSYGIHCAKLVGFPKDVIQWAIEHQKNLEHEEGLSLIKDYENSLKKKIVQEGDAIVKETLQKINSWDLGNMGEEEIQNEVKKLKKDITDCDNLFVKGLLTV